MDKKEAKSLVERSLRKFSAAGLPQVDVASIVDVQTRSVATLWAGMGYVYDLTITSRAGPPISIMVKKVLLPKRCDSIGDQRKKASYDVEAAFYSQGHAERLLSVGCSVPFPLHVESDAGVIVCMTKLDGTSRGGAAGTDAFVLWLARLHAAFWGSRAEAACSADAGGGLQAQGCYWHLDTRPDEHKRMGNSGWMGRLKFAARAIDLRLKADPLQTVCHGDPKGANILYAGAGDSLQALVYDFQYCGKAAATKDLAYFFNVDVYPSATEEERLLRLYHAELSRLLAAQAEIPPSWEVLLTSFELALCDWRRFTEIGLGGWGDEAANRRVDKLLERLDGGKRLESEEQYIEAVWREFPVK